MAAVAVATLFLAALPFEWAVGLRLDLPEQAPLERIRKASRLANERSATAVSIAERLSEWARHPLPPLEPGPLGPRGPAGPAGPTGPEGPTGAQGAPSPYGGVTLTQRTDPPVPFADGPVEAYANCFPGETVVSGGYSLSHPEFPFVDVPVDRPVGEPGAGGWRIEAVLEVPHGFPADLVPVDFAITPHVVCSRPDGWASAR